MLAQLSQIYLLPLLFCTGVAAGTIDTIAGGGGLICLPMLLGIGLPPHLALGTNKLQTLFGTAVGAYTFHRKGWLNGHGLFPGIFFSFGGAILGAITIQILSSVILKKIIPILLLIVLIYTILSPKFGHHDEIPKMRRNWFYFIFGTALGFYDGFLGPGVGFFWVFSLVFFQGFNITKATAYTKVFNLNTNITAMVCFAIGHNIDYQIAFYMAAGQLIGGRVGAHLAIKKGVSIIRPLFILVVTATITTLIYRNYSNSKNTEILLFTIFSLISMAGIYAWNVKRRQKLTS